MNKQQLQIVTFDQAKKLKEIGFNFPCLAAYFEGMQLTNFMYSCSGSCNNSEKYFAAPTVSLALKWFREEKNKWVEIRIDSHKVLGFRFYIHKTCDYPSRIYSTYESRMFETYDEAEVELLDELLK